MHFPRPRDEATPSFSARFLVAVLVIVAVEAVALYAFAEQVPIASPNPTHINDAGRLGPPGTVVGGGMTILMLLTIGVFVFIANFDRVLGRRVGRRTVGQECRCRELSAANAELHASNAELEAFAYTISHDLKAPIRSLTGFSRLALECLDGTESAPLRHYLTRIEANARTMDDLLDDLLRCAKADRAIPRRTTVEPRTLVSEVLGDLLDADNGQHVDIQIGDLPPVHADRTLLRQVYQNLISNALKFTRDVAHPTIQIGSATLEETTAYFVRDNGIGFDMKYAEELFGIFRRLDNGKAYEGTGVGLAIVDRIVRKHGGRIWAESSPGEGATFYFTLGIPANTYSGQAA